LYGILKYAYDYGLISPEWLGAPLLYVAWLVPVVVDWDEDGRPVFDWPDHPAETEQDLPTEIW